MSSKKFAKKQTFFYVLLLLLTIFLSNKTIILGKTNNINNTAIVTPIAIIWQISPIAGSLKTNPNIPVIIIIIKDDVRIV